MQFFLPFYISLELLTRLKKSKAQLFCFVGFNESPIIVMKNAFYFMVKTLFVLKILKYLTFLA